MVVKEALKGQGLVEIGMEFGETAYLMLSLDEQEPRLLQTVTTMVPSAWQHH